MGAVVAASAAAVLPILSKKTSGQAGWYNHSIIDIATASLNTLVNNNMKEEEH